MPACALFNKKWGIPFPHHDRPMSLLRCGAVVISESTRKLLGNLFELQDLGAKDLKGIAGPVRAWAALRASSVESPAILFELSRSDFVLWPFSDLRRGLLLD
jgi:hypothetical protein